MRRKKLKFDIILKMYTIVFKWKDDTMVVFDVYHTKHGKQRVIGNIFCSKEEGGYKAQSLITISSVPLQPTSKIPVEELYHNAEYICNMEWFNK